MKNRIYLSLVSAVMMLTFCLASCQNDQSESTPSNENKITSLQAVIDSKDDGDEINLSEYNITDYNAAISKALTITNGDIGSAALTVSVSGVTLDNITGSANVTTNSSMKITGSTLAGLTIASSSPSQNVIIGRSASAPKVELTNTQVTGSIMINIVGCSLDVSGDETDIHKIEVKVSAEVKITPILAAKISALTVAKTAALSLTIGETTIPVSSTDNWSDIQASINSDDSSSSDLSSSSDSSKTDDSSSFSDSSKTDDSSLSDSSKEDNPSSSSDSSKSDNLSSSSSSAIDDSSSEDSSSLFASSSSQDNSSSTDSSSIDDSSESSGDDSSSESSSGDDNRISFGGVEYSYTEFVTVVSEEVIITGSDENWNSYQTTTDDDRKGVFISGRNVKLSPYMISKYEVTQKLYEAIMNTGRTSSTSVSDKKYDKGYGDDYPVYYVSWYAAIAFCNKLSIKMGKTPCYSVKESSQEIDWENLAYSSIPTESNENWNNATLTLTANGYRLPTEAEWEFAARGGLQTDDSWKYAFAGIDVSDTNKGENFGNISTSGDDNLTTVAWYDPSSKNGGTTCLTQLVGQKQPNRLDIFDMSGNVSEWCWDKFSSTVTASDEFYKDNESDDYVTNPLGVSSDSITNRVVRGGSYYDNGYSCSVSYRGFVTTYTSNNQSSLDSTYGLRLACTITE